MHIGIDFDNTIAGYDHLFLAIGKERGWLPGDFTGAKKAVRDAIRDLDEGELKWMELQAVVYGAHIPEACLIEGVGEFLKECIARSVSVFIVSHKTEFAPRDPNRVNLRDAALRWMEAQNFFSPKGFAIPRDQVFFAETREEKCHRIASLDLAHFIDDLEEVFLEPSFPGSVEKHLYHPGADSKPAGPFRVHLSWAEIQDDILSSS